MKKIVLGLCILLFLFGCEKEDSSQKKYNAWVKELQNPTISNEEIPFKVEVAIEEFTEDEWRYHVIIDEPQEEVTNIRALVVHDKQTEDIFPSIGIFDPPVSMIPGKVKEEVGIVKGVALVGYLPKKNTEIMMTVKIEYQVNQKTKIFCNTYSFDK